METISSPSKASLSDNDAPLTLDAAIRHLLALSDESARRFWITQCVHDFSVDEFLPVLKDESERYLNIDPYISLRLAETLVSAGELVNRPDLHALGVMATGDAFRVLGRFQESVAAMDRAADMYLALGDEVGRARTRNGWLWSVHRLGHGEAALMIADEACETLIKHRVWARAATLKFSTAYVCSELGRYQEALARYDHAQTMYTSLGEVVEIQTALLKTNKAILLTQLADFQTALQLFEETRSVYTRHGHTGSLLRREEWVAFVYAAQGHYTQALWRYGSVRAAMERAGLDIDATDVALNMIECYLNLNRDDDALELAEETIRRFERYGTPTEAAKARFYCALAHAHIGDNERALIRLEEAAHSFATAGLATQHALATLQRATLYLNDENWSAAHDEAERAGVIFADRGLVIRQAQADLVRARAAVAQGDNDMAESLARSALATSRDRAVRWLAHEGYHVLGAVAHAQGDLDTALNAYRSAVSSIEQMQSSLAIELRANFLADKIRVYEDTIAICLRLSKPELAFTYLERAKSRALVDYLANNREVQIKAREGADQELLDTLTRLREEHNWFYNRLSGYGIVEHKEAGPTLSEEALRAAIREREKQIARILERLALDRTEGLAIVTPPVAEERPTLPHLDPGTVLLEYYFHEGDGAVFVVSPAELTVVPLTARITEIQRLLHQWNLNLATTARAITSNTPLDGLSRNARGILAALHRALIAPVEAHLAGCERVVIIPYGPTHSVPFHALYDGQRYLLEAMEVSICPSSSLLELCAERPHHAEASALVMAYSDGGRLPAVLEEARAVAALLPGECYVEEAATRATLAAASRHGILHLAAHGEARLDNPTFAHLKLADGQLSMVDIFNLPLTGALVTLSACETGRSVVTGGDELIGLSRGFLYAGAATLVESLWRVEDGSTAELMVRLYEGIRSGQPKGTALREAQQRMLADHGVHPYYWAPFRLVGDAGPL